MNKPTLREVLAYLDGSEPLLGCWYGEGRPEGEKGNFWWRKHLREAYEEACRASASVALTDEQIEGITEAWEALQRMIEDGHLKGPASREDALAVARYRRYLLSPRAILASAGSQTLPTETAENRKANKLACELQAGVDLTQTYIRTPDDAGSQAQAPEPVAEVVHDRSGFKTEYRVRWLKHPRDMVGMKLYLAASTAATEPTPEKQP